MSKKLKSKKYRLLVDEKGKDIADSIASVLGVATKRIGKLQFAPISFLEKWDACLEQFEVDKEEWQNNMPIDDGTGEPTDIVNKISLNVNK